MTPESGVRTVALPITTAQLERVSLVCHEVADGDGIGIVDGQSLLEIVDERDHGLVVSALERTGVIDLPMRHRDGRTLRIRARIDEERIDEPSAVPIVILDDTIRTRDEASSRIEARTLRAFSRATTLADAVQPLMEGLGDVLGLRFIELWLIDHRTGTLRRAASVSRGLPPFHLERVTAPMEAALQEGFARAVAESDGIIWSRDLRQEPRLYRRKEAILDDLKGVVGIRIGSDTRELGALLMFTDNSNDLDPHVLALLERLGQQFSLLTFTLRRGDLLQRSQRRLRFITDLSRVLDTSKSPEALVRSLLDAVVPKIGDIGILERIERRRIERFTSTTAVPVPAFGPDVELVPNRIVGRAKVQPGTPLSALGARHVLVAPVTTRTTAHGRLILLSMDDPFDEDEELIVREVARRAAATIEHANLFAHRSHIARTLQQSLLPATLPAIDGFEIAARYEAAGDGIDSGGDFYDLFPTGGSSWAAMIGDVQGKGPEAAAITALARYTLRAAALRARRPSRILKLLNDALTSNEQTDRTCTVAFARIVKGERGVRATLCLAGHLQPLLRTPNGTVDAVGTVGRFLGSWAQPRLADHDLELVPGTVLVFYTDGITEARSPSGEEFGEHRLRELVAQQPPDATADAIADAIRNEALRWQAGVASDDIALLVMRAVS